MPNIFSLRKSTDERKAYRIPQDIIFFVLFAYSHYKNRFFMLFYRPLYEGVSWTEWLGVMWHGLPLDLSLAGYLTAIPGLLFYLFRLGCA